MKLSQVDRRLVAYYRVSTQKQGASGLGLEAQRALAEEHAESVGGRIVAEFREIETGTKKRHRPELERAVIEARLRQGTLCVAKLDRLARNVAFLSRLMEADVPFVCCDQPHATRFTIHILAAVAEEESRMISERTKVALAAAKRRGVKLGNPTGFPSKRAQRAAVRRSAAVRREALTKHYADLVPIVAEMRRRGVSYGRIAAELNDRGYLRKSGSEWGAVQVYRLSKLALQLAGKLW